MCWKNFKIAKQHGKEPKCVEKQTQEGAVKKEKLTRKEQAEIRMQKKEAKEYKRTVKRAVKGQDRLKLTRDKATMIEPDNTPYDGYYEDLFPLDTKRHNKQKIDWTQVIRIMLLVIAGMFVVALCGFVLGGI